MNKIREWRWDVIISCFLAIILFITVLFQNNSTVEIEENLIDEKDLIEELSKPVTPVISTVNRKQKIANDILLQSLEVDLPHLIQHMNLSGGYYIYEIYVQPDEYLSHYKEYEQIYFNWTKQMQKMWRSYIDFKDVEVILLITNIYDKNQTLVFFDNNEVLYYF